MGASIYNLPFLFLSLCLLCQAEIYYRETFDNPDEWVLSSYKSDYGRISFTAGAHPVDEEKQKGLKLMEDSKTYAVSKKLPKPITNDGKSVVFSFQIKDEQTYTCGGRYLKFLPAMDQSTFNGETTYWLMFGPDTCGYVGKIHIIFHFEGRNYLWKTEKRFPEDFLSHVYTLEIRPDNTFELYMDAKSIHQGNLEDEWEMVAPKTIDDPTDKMPEDWDSRPQIEDPDDHAPEGWDDEPPTIPDPEAKKPSYWDDLQDGEWVAPTISNSNYKGEWMPRYIDNPNYKGKWKARQLPNPKYVSNPNLYKITQPLQYVGIDVWQVESGTIFSNILIGDDIKEVLEIVNATYGAIVDREKEIEDRLAEERERLRVTPDENEETPAPEIDKEKKEEKKEEKDEKGDRADL